MQHTIKVVKARFSDANIFFDWVNDPAVRQNSINTEHVSWDQHITWFKGKLKSGNSYLFIGYVNGEPMGQVRFDKDSEYYLVDYSIDKKYRGKGLAADLLHSCIQNFKKGGELKGELKAVVKKNNIASAKVFKKLKFVEEPMGIIDSDEFFVFKFSIER